MNNHYSLHFINDLCSRYCIFPFVVINSTGILRGAPADPRLMLIEDSPDCELKRPAVIQPFQKNNKTSQSSSSQLMYQNYSQSPKIFVLSTLLYVNNFCLEGPCKKHDDDFIINMSRRFMYF